MFDIRRSSPARNAAFAVGATAAIFLVLAAGLNTPPGGSPGRPGAADSCEPEPLHSGSTRAIIMRSKHPLDPAYGPLPIRFGVGTETAVSLTLDDCYAEKFARTHARVSNRVVFNPVDGLPSPSATW